MTDWIYTARERFTPSNIKWGRVLELSGITLATEIVTLDNVICPDLFGDLNDEDWSRNIQMDGRITWFRDADYLHGRCDLRRGRDQLIAMLEQPEKRAEPPAGFVACGFDIVDRDDMLSPLTHGLRFRSIFNPSDLNSWGLVSTLDEANAIAARIRTDYPNEPHCFDCRVWQLARRAEEQ